MLTYWKFKQIYKHTPYWQYVWNSFKSWFRGVINIPRATYLCLKYPFLYPRNRITGLHYNNWKVLNFMNKLNTNYHQLVFLSEPNKEEIESNSNQPGYQYISDRSCSYWLNWWAKPLHRIVRFYHNCILQIFHCLPTYTEWDCMEPGWKKAFGKQYLKDLKEAVIKDGYLKLLRIMQLKEKWGRCQLYLNSYGDNVFKVIQKYEKLSWETCVKCGKPATHTSTGWICPYCEECTKSSLNSKYVGPFIKRGAEEEKTLILY